MVVGDLHLARRTVTLDLSRVDLTQCIESGFDSGTTDFSDSAARRLACGTCLALSVENLVDLSVGALRS